MHSLCAQSQHVPSLAERHERCDEGESLVCFGLGRTAVTAMFLELEDARLNLDRAVTERTGLRGGWGVGVRFGIEIKDWVPLYLGVRHVAPNDDRPYSQLVQACQAEIGGPWMCDPAEDMETKSSGVAAINMETGLQPSVRLVPAWSLSPGVLFGYANQMDNFSRNISACSGCTSEPLNVYVNGSYVAASLRLQWLAFGIAIRYERYLSGDLTDGVAIGFDLGARYKAVALQLPGED